METDDSFGKPFGDLGGIKTACRWTGALSESSISLALRMLLLYLLPYNLLCSPISLAKMFLADEPPEKCILLMFSSNSCSLLATLLF